MGQNRFNPLEMGGQTSINEANTSLLESAESNHLTWAFPDALHYMAQKPTLEKMFSVVKQLPIHMCTLA